MDHANNVQRDKQGGRATDLENLKKLWELDLIGKLGESRYFFVAEELLDSLRCVQLENIDVDLDHSKCTTAVAYFQPSQPIVDGLKKVLMRARWELGHPGQAPRLYPEHKAGWFVGPWAEPDGLEDPEPEQDELQIDRFGGSDWECVDDRCYVRDTTGLALPMGIWNNGHEYSSDFAFLAKDKKKPHLTCIISDTEISPNKILRSEIHGIFNLVMYRMAFKGFNDHRIKPVMLYTFQGNDYARITQAYFDPDMDKIVIRQSRMFDLRGPEPTKDGWLLMRWILSTPVGDTQIQSEDGGLPVRAKERVVSPLKPTTDATA